MSNASDRVGMTPKKARAALERLGKWRSIYAGWQLGTRKKGDPENEAVRDAAEGRLIARVEMSAMTALLIEKGVFSHDEFYAQVGVEAEALCKTLEKKFPGIHATDVGMAFDPRVAPATMAGWKP